MKNRKYFFGDASGLNADIERHRDQEKRIQELIEATDNEIAKASYRNLLNQLDASKAEVVSQIGKK